MKENSINKVWEIVGKVALGLGIIWSLIQISQWLFKEDVDLIANIEHMDFHRTPFHEAFFDRTNALYSYDYFTKKFDSLDANDQKIFNKNLVQTSPNDNGTSYGIEQLYYDDQFVARYSKVIIENRGEITSKNTILDISLFHPKYIKISDDGEITFLKESNILSFGEIRPNEKIMIIIWSSTVPRDVDGISLSHDLGVGKVIIGQTIFTLPYFFELITEVPILKYSIPALFLLIMFQTGLFIFEKGKSTQKNKTLID